MSRIKPHFTLLQAIIAMADGNPGALTVLVRLHEEGTTLAPDLLMGGLGTIMLLDQYGIYGSHIWILYKDHCKEDLACLINTVQLVKEGGDTLPALQQAAGILNPPTQPDQVNPYVE